jgi:uncharacterized repeat protein (TIGR01451 family)
MPRPPRHGFTYSLLVFLLALVPAAFAWAQEGPPAPLPDEIPINAGTLADGRLQILIELPDTPAGVVYGSVLRSTEGGRDRALAAARIAAQSQLRTIGAAQERLTASLRALSVTEIYRVARAYNGIAIAVEPAKLALLRRLPGIKAIHPLVPEFPTNSTSVPFLGVPPLWNNSLGLGTNLTGTGIKIGIIDTGIDYQHANFGGTGLLTAYQANDTTTNADGFFPTAKVVGGTDFAGDAYNGGNTPVPDPDPMDCNGHGSHVAGTAAGLGVDAAGATFAGPYDPSAPFGAFRIGPGVAPGASLYALRVFGCGGSTGLTIQAIDWSIDPNNDTDFSDHLDVINMSLGSNFGGASSSTAVASENAAIAGVIVVAAAGNAGDTFYIVSAPSSANRALSVAASADSGLAGAILQVNSPAGIAGGYAALGAGFIPAPPAPSGQTAAVIQALDAANASGPSTTDGCTALTNAAAVAGNIALIDRGTCGFLVKVQNAQAAGAIGAIVVNNAVGDPNLTVMGGTAPPGPAVTIPSVFISLADGNTIKAQLGTGVNATLAAANAGDTIGSFSSRGSRLGAPFHLKPDVSAPGVSITSTQSGKTCVSGGCLVPNASGFIPGSQALTISGTSMATPHMAGVMALLRQLHPDWTVEELKAAAMNGALHEVTIGANGSGLKYTPGRIGAGRVDPQNSAQASVVAFDSDQSGVVSVTFDAPVVGIVSQVKHVRVVNHGATAATYDLGIDIRNDAPGIAFSLPGGSTVTVPAGQTAEFDVQMDGNANQMRHVRDATVAATQAAPGSLAGLGNLVRHWATEEEGYITLSQGGNVKLKVPVYMAARPASAMSAGSTITTGGANTGSTTIALSGTDVCTGTLGAGPVCTATTAAPTFDEVSLVSPFELQVVSTRDPVNAPPEADIQYAGVAYDPVNNLILFGVSTWGSWSTPTEVAFNIYVDANSDGTYDRILFNSNPASENAGLFGGASGGQDSFINSTFNLATSGVSIGGAGLYVNRLNASVIDSALFNNSVMILAATPAQLGLPAGTTNFKWKIQTCPGFAPLCGPLNGFFSDEAAGPFSWNYAAASQGLNFAGKHLAQDLNGASLPVTWNLANLAANGSQGALLLHHHNAAGNRAEVVVVEGTQSADLSISKSMAPPNPTIGQNVTFTVTVTNAGPGAATGVVVSDSLPVGLTYVSDDGGGAYVPATGIWTVGSIAVAGSATLHIVATVQTTDPVDNLAQIVASSPLDTNPANNQSTVSVLAPRAADLSLSMTVSSPTVLVGNPVTFTLTVTNTGNDPAFSVNVQEAFPAYPLLNPTSFTASQGVYNPATGVWNLASLGKGNSATLAITLNAPNIAGPLTDQGTAAATTSDPNNANNTASATVTVLSPAVVSGTKTVAGTFTEGGTVTYTVVLSNTGTNTQQDNPGNEFTDFISSGLTLVSATASSGTATAIVATNTVNWSGAIPAGGNVTITITATIKAGTFGQTINNQGSINFDADGNGQNEATTGTDDPAKPGATDVTSFLVLSPAAVSGTKTVSGNFAEGGNVTYTVVLRNTGTFTQQDNPGDEFVDVLPAGLLLTGATATAGTATTDVSNTVHWNGAIAAGASVTITITATVKTGTAGTAISNQGTIHFDADGNQTNESTVQTDDPAVGGASDPTIFRVPTVAQIPTLSGLGLAALALLLAAGAFVALRKKSVA